MTNYALDNIYIIAKIYQFLKLRDVWDEKKAARLSTNGLFENNFRLYSQRKDVSLWSTTNIATGSTMYCFVYCQINPLLAA